MKHILTVIGAIIALAFFLLDPGFSAPPSSPPGQNDNPRLEGSWLVDASVVGDPTAIHALLTCTPNGEVVETPSIETSVSAGHGAWIKTGKNEFAITVL